MSMDATNSGGVSKRQNEKSDGRTASVPNLEIHYGTSPSLMSSTDNEDGELPGHDMFTTYLHKHRAT